MCRYSLSVSLWVALWGPCSIAVMMFFGLMLIAQHFALESAHPVAYLPNLFNRIGWTAFSISLLAVAGFATVCAWVHQAFINRLPFFVFRIYATVVVAGVGSVFGWCLDLAIGARSVHYGVVMALGGMMILVTSFGFLAYRYANELRAAPRGLVHKLDV